MSRNEKLRARFLTMPTDFHYDEMLKLLKFYGFEEVAGGKTSGSRVKFINMKGDSIYMHKPHPGGILKRYQLKQVKEFLGL